MSSDDLKQPHAYESVPSVTMSNTADAHGPYAIYSETTMKDEKMDLRQRIRVAIERIKNGYGNMRIPAEATDPDIVLSHCAERIKELQAKIDLADGHLALAEKYASDPTGRTFHVFAARKALGVVSDETKREG